jgi:hypothetical protein
MELEKIILREVSQAKKAKDHIYYVICRIPNANTSNIMKTGYATGRSHLRE